MHHIEDWKTADVMQHVKDEVTVAGILKTPVWNQLVCGHAVYFVVGKSDWNPASVLVQMTVCRGKTVVLTIKVFAKEKPLG